MALLRDLERRIEDMEALDRFGHPLAGVVGRATRPDALKSALSGTWLGHQLHPMLTDLPIGAWVMGQIVDLTMGRAGAKPAQRLVGLGVLAALPTAATGASDWSETRGGEQRVGLVHALGNLAAVGLQSLSWLTRRQGHRLVGIALSTTSLGLSVGAAYLGGSLSFVRGVGVNHTAFDDAVLQWSDVAALSELVPDKPVRVSPGGVPVVLVQHEDSVYALSATCVHAGGPLDEGQVADGCLRCPWHSSTYRLRDGEVIRGPAAMDQPSWDVRVDQGRIFVRSQTPKPKPETAGARQ
jgi:nitrite reductase/ring-hydroxylating ferredoxin subunit/uncharacterized membrane protein